VRGDVQLRKAGLREGLAFAVRVPVPRERLNPDFEEMEREMEFWAQLAVALIALDILMATSLIASSPVIMPKVPVPAAKLADLKSGVSLSNFGDELYIQYDTNHTDSYGSSQAFYGLWFHTVKGSITFGPSPCPGDGGCGPGGSSPTGFSGLIPACTERSNPGSTVYCFGNSVQVLMSNGSACQRPCLSVQWQTPNGCRGRLYVIAQGGNFTLFSKSSTNGVCGRIGASS
jgi:hypothetical protein